REGPLLAGHERIRPEFTRAKLGLQDLGRHGPVELPALLEDPARASSRSGRRVVPFLRRAFRTALGRDVGPSPHLRASTLARRNSARLGSAPWPSRPAMPSSVPTMGAPS